MTTAEVQQNWLIWFRPFKKRAGKWKDVGRCYGTLAAAGLLLNLIRGEHDRKGQGGDWQVLSAGQKPDARRALSASAGGGDVTRPTLFDGPNTHEVVKGAVLSDDGLYRYRLTRTWDAGLPTAFWILLNPSTADHTKDDPTVKRCVAFARAWGKGGIDVRNLFAWRSSDPDDLKRAFDPVGPDNDEHHFRGLPALSVQEAEGHAVVAGWGDGGGLNSRDRVVVKMLEKFAIRLVCLGVTASGAPKHPLARGRSRVPDDFVPVPYPPEKAGAR